MPWWGEQGKNHLKVRKWLHRLVTSQIYSRLRVQVALAQINIRFEPQFQSNAQFGPFQCCIDAGQYGSFTGSGCALTPASDLRPHPVGFYRGTKKVAERQAVEVSQQPHVRS